MRIAAAQQTFSVGDCDANAHKIISMFQQMDADLLVFPELALSGYPPEDLLWQPDFQASIEKALRQITAATCQRPDSVLVLGFPHYVENTIYNAACVIQNGKWLHVYHKQCLPNQGVFNEKRYFTPGNETFSFLVKDISVGLLICEDIWQADPLAELEFDKDPDLVMIINASPFSVAKHQERLSVLTQNAKAQHIPLLYVNGVNAQDDLIFDGGSCYVDAKGHLEWQGSFFEEHIYFFDIIKNKEKIEFSSEQNSVVLPEKEALMYGALVLGVRSYIEKNAIAGVVVGLSGGIDSALTLAVAVDALGPSRVQAIFLPSHYTAKISEEIAKKQAEYLGVSLLTLNIEPIYHTFLDTLSPVFSNIPQDITEENIQARTRGTLLMAYANKFHYIVLGTSNKSEQAVGYGTLYGDMIGGYNVLKDVLKTEVYRLAHYRNQLGLVIPEEVIARKPSAELAFNQCDQDTLPPYDMLDAIIDAYVVKQHSIQSIIDAGFSADHVKTIIQKINQNEYKRRQGPPGPKLSERAFYRERRFPITHTSRE